MANDGSNKKVELMDLIKKGWFEETQSFWSGKCPSICLFAPPLRYPLINKSSTKE